MCGMTFGRLDAVIAFRVFFNELYTCLSCPKIIKSVSLRKNLAMGLNGILEALG